MTALIFLGLVALGVLFDRLWLWARAMDRANVAQFGIRDAKRYAVSDIAERRRRAEEQMRRIAFRGRS